MTDRTDPPWLSDLLDALGWQGGTIHHALAEVRKLAANRETAALLADQLTSSHRMRDEGTVLRQALSLHGEPLVIVTGCGAAAKLLDGMLARTCCLDPRSLPVDG
jgi:hypothetical protein